MECRSLFSTMRRVAFGAAALSLIIYAALIGLACEFSLKAGEHYQRARDEVANSTGTLRTERLEKYDTAKDEQLSYLFWTWMAILFAFTICIDAGFLLPAALFKSKIYARMYLFTISMMYILNLTPLMFVLDIDTSGKSEGKFSIFWFGWITGLVYVHRILNMVVVWFLLGEIDQPDEDRQSHRPSIKQSKTNSQINPLTPPITGSFHHAFQVDAGSIDRSKGDRTSVSERRQSKA